MKFIDVELAWVEDHEDFTAANFFHLGGAPEDPYYSDHGTAVLGEVVGTHNSYGIDGFAPDVNFGMVAIDINDYPDVPQYFQEAVDNLDAGDVWLIELQMYPSGRDATPMEYVQVNYDVIWTGVFARGVVCVEAGANGSQDLDAGHWGGIFDRTVRDSGAIMVGAGTPTGRVAEWFTNYGSRMDVHAWGSQIVTSGYGDLYNGGSLQTEYTSDFGGTSGASPMIVGSSLCLQGIARANLSRVLEPLELRSILHDTGIDHLDPSREIGPRPDLNEAAGMVLSLGSPVVICGPGPAYDNPPLVRLFPPEQDASMVNEFPAYGVTHYGVNVACGDVDGDGIDEIITAPGPSGFFGAHLRGWNYDGSAVAAIPGISFFAWDFSAVQFGARISSGIDFDGDGRDDLLAGPGPDSTAPPQLKVFGYDGASTSLLFSLDAFDAEVTHGINAVGGVI